MRLPSNSTSPPEPRLATALTANSYDDPHSFRYRSSAPPPGDRASSSASAGWRSPTTARDGHTAHKRFRCALGVSVPFERPPTADGLSVGHPQVTPRVGIAPKREVSRGSGHQKEKSDRTGEHPEADMAMKPRIKATPTLLVMRDIALHSSRYHPALAKPGRGVRKRETGRSRLRTTNSWLEGAHHRIQTRSAGADHNRDALQRAR